jgi:hypothetical protein
MSQVPIEKDRKTAAHGENDLWIRWTEENAAAIAERRTWIEANGVPLADVQVLKVDWTWRDACAVSSDNSRSSLTCWWMVLPFDPADFMAAHLLPAILTRHHH